MLTYCQWRESLQSDLTEGQLQVAGALLRHLYNTGWTAREAVKRVINNHHTTSEKAMNDLATILVVETPGKSIRDPYQVRTIGLGAGLTLAEIWERFSKLGRSKPIVTLCKGTARVTY